MTATDTSVTAVTTLHQNEKRSRIREKLQKDERAFIEDCEQGVFYEKLMEATGTEVARDEFKRVAFRDIFYSNKDYPSVARAAFTALYPHVMETIVGIRRRSKAEGMVSCMMQFIESRLVINTIGQRLMGEGIRFLTLHDAIGSSARNIDRIIEVTRQEYEKVGLHPSFKTE